METFVPALTIFILALFVGFEIITKVPPLLHTPPHVRCQCHIRDNAGGNAHHFGCSADTCHRNPRFPGCSYGDG